MPAFDQAQLNLQYTSATAMVDGVVSNNHLRPRNFPLNTVIFTGRLPQYQLREDHGLQVERLVRDNRFLTYERRYPNVWVDLVARLLAFAMLCIGGICLILIGWRFLQ
jgi:hypothetical protein